MKSDRKIDISKRGAYRYGITCQKQLSLALIDLFAKFEILRVGNLQPEAILQSP